MTYVRKMKPLVKFDASYYQHRNWVPNIQYSSIRHLDSSAHSDRSSWITHVGTFNNSDFGKLVSERVFESSDPETLRTIVQSQGLFSEKFFHRNIRPRVMGTYVRLGLDIQQIEKLLTDAAGYQYRIYNKSEAVFSIIDHIYSTCTLILMHDTVASNSIDEWLDEHSASQACALCGSVFKVTRLPNWVYFGGNGYKHCCFNCFIVDRPIKRDLHTIIPDFVAECGFIPTSSAGPIEYSFTSRIPHYRWKNVILAYAKMGGIEHVKKKYGTWFQGLAETKALPEGVLTTARGIRCLSNDKHVCHSLDEQRIDNWLFQRGIGHEREPLYPAHDELNPSERRRADWKVGDCFIEYFGLIGDPIYDKKLDEKIQLAEISGINLISLFPEDLESLEKKLGHLQ